MNPKIQKRRACHLVQDCKFKNRCANLGISCADTKMIQSLNVSEMVPECVDVANSARLSFGNKLSKTSSIAASLCKNAEMQNDQNMCKSNLTRLAKKANLRGCGKKAGREDATSRAALAFRSSTCDTLLN